jgi:hypothetical protein
MISSLIFFAEFDKIWVRHLFCSNVHVIFLVTLGQITVTQIVCTARPTSVSDLHYEYSLYAG